MRENQELFGETSFEDVKAQMDLYKAQSNTIYKFLLIDNSVTVTFTVYQTYDLIVFYNSALQEISVFGNNNRMEENITKSFNAERSI